MSLKHFGAKQFLFEKNKIYRTCFVYRAKNTVCSDTISAGLPKPLCMFQLKHFEEKHFSEKYFRFFYPFGLWVRNLWPNTKKKSMRLSKPHFTCLWDQCRGRHFLIEILSFYDNRILIQNTFSLLLTNSLRSLQSRIFCFHMNFLMKNILLERILGFINIFWNWVKNYWPSAKRFSIGLTKFGSTCPKEHSESKKVVLENVQF